MASPSPRCSSSDEEWEEHEASLRARPPSLPRRMCGGIARLVLRPVRELFFISSWVVWLFSSITLGTGQLSIVLYSAVRITLSLLLYLLVIVCFRAHDWLHWLHCKALCYAQRHVPRAERIRHKKAKLEEATDLEEWQRVALELDKLCGHNSWKASPHGSSCDFRTLRHVSAELMQFRQAADWRGLLFLLSTILNRQFCRIGSEALYAHSYHGTKYAVESFYCQVVEQLSWIARTDFGPEFSTRAKLRFMQRARRTLGKTVLCLSGGGALAMYHCGVCRAMVKGNCLPSIINGTSGGSIIAALVGTRTDAELRDPDFLSPTICSRYGVENRWLPTLQQQVDQFVRNRVLMDWRVFSKSAQVVFGEDLTFEDAYRRTQRELNITVTWAGRDGAKAHPLVLNHISSPHVFVWSAVTCSCALPGLMVAQTLMCRGPDGKSVQPFDHHGGAEVLDGSLHADIPVQRLTELFNAQCFIVSQTNPHVIDFVRDGSEGKGRGTHSVEGAGDGHAGDGRDGQGKRGDRDTSSPSSSDLLDSESDPSYRRPRSASSALLGPSSRIFTFLTGLEKFLQADIGHRLQRLAKLKVIPRIYRQDFRHVIAGNQRYTGDINIVPRIPFLMRLKALTHPSTDDMTEYFRGGEVACFPKISRIQNSLLLERTLEECVRSLSQQLKREQARRIRRQQRQQHGPPVEQRPDVRAAAPAQPVAPLSPQTRAHAHAHAPRSPPTAPAPSSSAVGSPLRRSRKSSGASGHGHAMGSILLPDALSGGGGSSAGGSGSGGGGHRSLGFNRSAGIHTLTAAVLAKLPMHGAVDATDTEAESARDEAASPAHGALGHGHARLGAILATTTGGSSSSSSHSPAPHPHPMSHSAHSHTHASASVAFVAPEDAPFESTSSGSACDDAGSAAPGSTSSASSRASSPSRTTTASYVDFDAEEAANHELMIEPHEHEQEQEHEHEAEQADADHDAEAEARLDALEEQEAQAQAEAEKAREATNSTTAAVPMPSPSSEGVTASSTSGVATATLAASALASAVVGGAIAHAPAAE